MVERGSVLTAIAVVACGSLVSMRESAADRVGAPAPPKPAEAKQPAPKPTPASPGNQPPAQLSGATQVMKLTTDTGFVDEVLALDGQRLAYVVADTATRSELHVVQLGCADCIEKKQEIVVDLSPVTMRPVKIKLVGQRAFVIGATEDGNQVAALVELSKKAATSVYKLGPAAHISLVMRDGKQRVAVHKTAATKTGVRHDVEIVALETGKKVSKGKAFELDKDHHKKLDFRVNHWSDGWTRVHGLKGGEWNKKENQRSPDTEATYDLVSGKFVENKPISDVVEQRKRHQSLADFGGQLEVIRMVWDNSGINIWSRGVPRVVGIDRPLQQYDPKSLQGVVAVDGSAWLALKIDPVNPEAVNRKKADLEYLDVFKLDAGANKATMKARIPAKGLVHKFGVLDGYFWLLERSGGFDRGGRSVTIYQLQ
jgi:hypothetical protein